MKRWILALLVLLNFGLLLWSQMHTVATPPLAPEIIRPPGVQDILLLREADQRQPVAAATEPEFAGRPVTDDASPPETASEMLQEAGVQDPATESIAGGPEIAAVISVPESEAKAEAEATPEVELAAETQAGPDAGTEPEPQAESEPQPESEPICGRIGPYEDKAAAEKHRDELRNSGISLDIAETTEQVRNGYWVLIPALPSTREARDMVDKLEAAGVTDLWRFPKGPMKNTISLGWYLGIKSATKVSESINEKGFESEVRPKMSAQTRYWLNYRATDEQALANRVGKLSAGLVNEKKACE